MNDCPRCHTPIPGDALHCSQCPPDYTLELRERLARTLEGQYEIIRLLGRGGMAVVFLAEDLVLERQVAIKVLPPDLIGDGHLLTRFQQEGKTAAKLDHPNIIPIHRVESEGGLAYIVMKYVAGQSLEDKLNRSRGRLPIPQVRQILREAALALGHAHRRHVVHRDVKPANIMLDEDGRVVLTDFGISKAVQGSTQITSTGTIIGTPQYMSPEQAKGRNVDGRSDQYALAVVGYRVLTGKVPFEGDPQSVLYQQVHEPPTSLLERRPDTPPDLRVAIERALAKDPKARYPSMEEFAAWVSGERASSLDASTVTAVRAPVTAVRTPARTLESANSEGQGAGVYVALGTLAVILTAAFIGIPKLRTPVDPPPAVASTPNSPKSSAPSQRRASGSLQIRSNPRAVLYIDGVKVGLTPVTRSKLAAGSYRVRLELKGYRTVTENLMVKAGRSTSRSYQLRRR